MAWNAPAGYQRSGREQSRSGLQGIRSGCWFESQDSSHPYNPHNNLSQSSYKRASDQSNSSSGGQSSPVEAAAAVISRLKDKSTEEVEKLLDDTEEYEEFFKSLNLVKYQFNLHQLEEEIVLLAKDILEKEPDIVDLKNQCMIIRTTELTEAKERLNELERQKEDILNFFSLESLLRECHNTTGKIALESEVLQKRLLDKDIELSSFVQKYQSLRTSYHRRCLVDLAAKTQL